MHKEGMISLVNAREVISTSGREIILLVTSQKVVSLGKGRAFQDQFETNLLREARTRSYPDAELPRCGATQTRSYSESRIYTIPRRTYSNPEAGLKAKLNSTTMATFVLHIPSIKAIQSILKPELFHCRLLKTLKGVLLTL